MLKHSGNATRQGADRPDELKKQKEFRNPLGGGV